MLKMSMFGRKEKHRRTEQNRPAVGTHVDYPREMSRVA